MEKITLNHAFERIWVRIKNNENFAFVRDADGERSIMECRPFTAQEGWKCSDKPSKLQKALLDTLQIDDDDFIFGLSCPCCDYQAYLWYLQHLKGNNMSFSNIWVNGNYFNFIDHFKDLKRDAIVIANYRGEGKPIGNLNVLKYYSVSDDCISFWDNESEIMINRIIDDYGSRQDILYVVAAGPMSGPIIARLFHNNRNNCYIDFGSSIDSFIHEKVTRPYMVEGRYTYGRNCWMYDLKKDNVLLERIPKIIHYCWFGRGEMPKLMKKCIKSWKKFCPDYKVVLWNEDNFDVNSTVWTKEAYEAKKYAFVTDYVRLKVLYENGGIYMDADVEVTKPLEKFLVHEAFSGFESKTTAPTGIIASVKGQPVIKRWLDYYTNRHYLVDGKPNMDPNVSFMTEDLKAHGLEMNNVTQNIDGMVIFSQSYFCPLSVVSVESNFSDNTHCIHHFTSTWRTKKALKDFARVKRHQTKWYRTLEKARYFPKKLARKILGDNRFERIKQRIKNE